jgi:hypothetical protein
MTLFIFGVINTLNAELSLPYALRSVRTRDDDIVVVDYDRTREISDPWCQQVTTAT